MFGNFYPLSTYVVSDFFFRSYLENEPMPHPDEFPGPMEFAMYWNSIPKHRRRPFTETDAYDRFITHLDGYDEDQIEYDEIDPVRPTLVRGMYFEELTELVLNYLEALKVERDQKAMEAAAAQNLGMGRGRGTPGPPQTPGSGRGQTSTPVQTPGAGKAQDPSIHTPTPATGRGRGLPITPAQASGDGRGRGTSKGQQAPEEPSGRGLPN